QAGSRKILKKTDAQISMEGSECYGLAEQMKSPILAEKYLKLLDRLTAAHIGFEFTFSPSRSIQALVDACQASAFEFVMVGKYAMPGLRNAFLGPLAFRIIGAIRRPIFVVPDQGPFAEIDHITYAVDLTDYDPNVIRQVKLMASVFDAKLSIAHVNAELEENKKESYLRTLERTISDTLDYPKVYYKFFDHSDALSGIQKFVTLNNSQLVAMINRKKFNWRNLFRRDESLTRRMTRNTKVPILAFPKY
ncbi:MAG: hypothetical protein AAF399_29360, partial [Bacteroidota bacterium]